MLKIEQLVPMVEQWGKDKGILDGSNSTKQLSKTKEEVYELIRDLTTPRDFEKIIDDVGDSLVTLILYFKLKDIDFLEFYNSIVFKFKKEEYEKCKITPRQLQKNLRNCMKNVLKNEEVGNSPAFNDDLEELFTLLFISAKYVNKTNEYCLESAYNIISKRTGKMVDGIFVRGK